MLIRTVKLYARFSDPDGSYPRIPVQRSKNGRFVQPTLAGCRLAQYVIRVGRKFVPVGTDFQTAITKLYQEQARISGGGAPELKPQPKSDRIRLIDAVKEYNEELKTLGKGKYTILMYKNALDGFVQSCSKTFMDEIERKDILNYIAWMRANLKTRVKGRTERTYKNRLGYLRTFLNKHQIKLVKKHADDSGLITRDDIPKPLKPKPRKYDQEMIDLLLKHADEDQKDYLEVLLWSGFRDEEVQFLTYSDFDFKNSKVSVQAKPQYNWRPKDAEERTVQLPSEISKRIHHRMDRNKRKPDDLVFPNGDGKPDSHLIYRLHHVAKKAGLNLKGQRAGHMFRKTAGSRVAKAFGLRAAMDFLGHSDIKTTSLYLAADDLDQKKSRQAYDEMYSNT